MATSARDLVRVNPSCSIWYNFFVAVDVWLLLVGGFPLIVVAVVAAAAAAVVLTAAVLLLLLTSLLFSVSMLLFSDIRSIFR